ncbi:MAG: hypothetical protein HC846_11565, partial [Blastocatellia bacterium]|nr:hypothetical protein [Blastocatellia bacterium]
NIEDIGSMRILPNMQIFVPFSSEDVFSSLMEMVKNSSPSYLRLNIASKQENIAMFSQWRKIKHSVNSPKAVVIGTGTVTDNLFKLPDFLLDNLEIWLLSQFPVDKIPSELLESISLTKSLITIEEHQGQCGLNEALGSLLLKQLNTSINFQTLFASGYPSGRYGSQQWHLEENSLAGQRLENKIKGET